MATELKSNEIKNVLELARFAPLKNVYAGVGALVVRLSSLVVKSQEQYDAAMDALKDTKLVREQLKDAKDQIIAKPKKDVDEATALFKAIDGPLDLQVNEAKQKMGKWQADEQEKRRKQEQALELKRQEELRKIETADTAKEQVKIAAKVEKIEAKQEDLLAFKPKTADKVRKFEVIEPEKVERQYCSPADSKIRPFIGKPGEPIPPIAGVRIWDEVKIVTR